MNMSQSVKMVITAIVVRLTQKLAFNIRVVSVIMPSPIPLVARPVQATINQIACIFYAINYISITISYVQLEADCEIVSGF